MFWFDYDKMYKLVSITFKLDKEIQKQIAKLFEIQTQIKLTFTDLDIYSINNANQEMCYINILYDMCCGLFDIDKSINDAINEELYYFNRTVINITGSYGITQIVQINGEILVRKIPKDNNVSMDEEYRFMRSLYLDNSNYFVKSLKDDYSDSYLMELANDTLQSYIVNNRNIKDDERESIINSIIDEVDYIHKRGIIHNDLHSENILLFKNKDDSKWKLSDFGLAYKIHEKSFVVSGLNPESRRSDYINYKKGDNTIQNDIYSIGKLLNFVYTNNPNSKNHPFHSVSEKCVSGKYFDVLEIKREFNIIANTLKYN